MMCPKSPTSLYTHNLSYLNDRATYCLAVTTGNDADHLVSQYFTLLLPGHRYRILQWRTCFGRCFVPSAIALPLHNKNSSLTLYRARIAHACLTYVYMLCVHYKCICARTKVNTLPSVQRKCKNPQQQREQSHTHITC